jgi:hypothetical protein
MCYVLCRESVQDICQNILDKCHHRLFLSKLPLTVTVFSYSPEEPGQKFGGDTYCPHRLRKMFIKYLKSGRFHFLPIMLYIDGLLNVQRELQSYCKRRQNKGIHELSISSYGSLDGCHLVTVQFGI